MAACLGSHACLPFCPAVCISRVTWLNSATYTLLSRRLAEFKPYCEVVSCHVFR